MKKIILMTAVVFSLSACAKRPDAIAPVSVGNAFDNISCQAAQEKLTIEKANLAALSEAQNSAATGDAIGVFLIGLPVGSITGSDQEGAVAIAKGQVLALENRLLSCQ